MENDAETRLNDIITAISNIHTVQGFDGNWNYDSYMLGLYNGLEMALSIAQGRAVNFRGAPDAWTSDRPHDISPTSAALTDNELKKIRGKAKKILTHE